MAIRGLSAQENGEYICKDDPCKTLEEGATVFYYGNIPSAIMARLSDMQATSTIDYGSNAQTFHQKNSAKNRESFRFGVKGWANYLDDNDEPIPFETQRIIDGGKEVYVVADSCIDRVRLETINEVGAHVFNVNALSEDKRKKFAQVSSLLGGSEASDAETAPKNKGRTGGAKSQRLKATTGMTPS